MRANSVRGGLRSRSEYLLTDARHGSPPLRVSRGPDVPTGRQPGGSGLQASQSGPTGARPETARELRSLPGGRCLGVRRPSTEVALRSFRRERVRKREVRHRVDRSSELACPCERTRRSILCPQSGDRLYGRANALWVNERSGSRSPLIGLSSYRTRLGFASGAEGEESASESVSRVRPNVEACPNGFR